MPSVLNPFSAPPAHASGTQSVSAPPTLTFGPATPAAGVRTQPDTAAAAAATPVIVNTLLEEIQAAKVPPATSQSLGGTSFAISQRGGGTVADSHTMSNAFGLASGILSTGPAIRTGASSLAVNNVDPNLFQLPTDITSLQAAYVAGTVNGGLTLSNGNLISESKIEPFDIAVNPHNLPIEKY